MIGQREATALRIVGSEADGSLALEHAESGREIAKGRLRLTTMHLGGNGAVIACVSAPSNRIGPVSGVNLGVNIKSIAVLLERSWIESDQPVEDWARLAARKAQFENWENCGVKPEGRPSPASNLAISADGSFSDDIADGNPGTTYNLVARSYTSQQAKALVRSAGLRDDSDPLHPLQIRLRIFRRGADTALIEQGDPLDGSNPGDAGFIALYVEPGAVNH